MPGICIFRSFVFKTKPLYYQVEEVPFGMGEVIMQVEIPDSFLQFFRARSETHISVEVMDDYWFQVFPLSASESEFVEEHLKTCTACQARVERFREVFPERKEPPRRTCG